MGFSAKKNWPYSNPYILRSTIVAQSKIVDKVTFDRCLDQILPRKGDFLDPLWGLKKAISEIRLIMLYFEHHETGLNDDQILPN